MIVGLAACGFTPVYAPGSQTSQTLSDIRVASPSNREEYLFVRNVEDRLGRNPNAENVLRYKVWLIERRQGLIGANRSQIYGKASYQLVSPNDDKIIATGLVESFTGYSSEATLSQASQRDTKERLMTILADRVITDLTARLLLP